MLETEAKQRQGKRNDLIPNFAPNSEQSKVPALFAAGLLFAVLHF
jgi:hypothetical protein